MLNTETIQSLIDSGEGYNVEFKVRAPSKVRELTEEICAFANADGGYLLIGVDDNGQVVGTNLENDKRSAIQSSISEISPALHCELYSVNVEGKTVWVIDIPSGKDKPYIFSGSIYVREGANSQKLRTVEEMRYFFQECNKIFFDHIPCSWFNIDTDADEQAIKDFRTEAQLSSSTGDKQIFENLELFTDKGIAKNGTAMFFGKEPERKFPHAITRCVLFKGTTKVYIIDDKSFGGPLYQQYLQAMAWLESKLQVAYKIEGPGPREEIWEIPLTVFKEAVINALSHRDYYEQGATITIEMFDDRVEVSNPGGLLPIVAKDFGHKSMTRNPLIFGLFTRMHLVEKVASGIPRMQEAMKEANLPEPEFHTEGMFTVVFKRQVTNSANYDTVNGRVNDIVNDTINKNEQAILNLLTTTSALNASEISKYINKSLRMTMRYIKVLQDKNLIEFRGAPKTGGYYLK
ncbi:AlbA family DNA-binding domain-containing protein [Parabacteroides massiliensis]|uniref:AlbA family DNA-binding domain-containing protein n=1 Tax=Parabacteroides massiliensis TaxID=1750560 RepID=UPI00096A6342|nr:helix-turn-helix domain-containing protein [Parabacteroides massiliensis]